MTREGGCECGAVRYRMTAEPIIVNCCHCRQCQKLSGSAFALNALVERDKVELLRGDAADGRCPACQTLLWGTHPMFGERLLFLRVGTLDAGERLSPDVHFFVRSKHPWVTIPEGMRTFETLPGDEDRPLLTTEAAVRLEAARGA